MELYKKHRPETFDQVFGQGTVCAQLAKAVAKRDVPHAVLFTGPSGCGKTTLARILRRQIGCGDADFTEANCAKERGIDLVRSITRRIGLAPIDGRCRVWLLDEAHQLTGDAQSAILKELEDQPKHAYFMLCTTHPQKLIKTIRTRCTEYAIKPLAAAELAKALATVAEAEGLSISKDVLDKIVENSEGSARKAIVLLDQVVSLEDEDAQLEAVSQAGAEAAAIEIARALIAPGTTWPVMAKILKEIQEDAESIRWLVLGYCKTVLLGGGKLSPRAFMIIEEFGRNFYDTKEAGLVAACYAVLHARK